MTSARAGQGQDGDVKSPLHKERRRAAAGNSNIVVTIVVEWLSGSRSTYTQLVVVPIKLGEFCKDSLTGAPN